MYSLDNINLYYFFQVDAEKHTMAKYLMEVTLPDYTSVKFLPSEIAAAALCLALKLLDNSAWVNTFLYYLICYNNY